MLIEGGLSNPHVKGGPQAVSNAFMKAIEDNGGEVLLGHLVDKIVLENNTACGVSLIKSSGAVNQREGANPSEPREIKGKYVVSNAAARQTFNNLIGEEKLSKKFINKLNKLEPTPPFSALFLGLDMDLKRMGFLPALHIHSSTYDTDEHFRNVAAKMVDENSIDPFFRFQLAPLSDPGSAPEGKTALVIHTIPVPSAGWEDTAWRNRAVELMIKRAENVYSGTFFPYRLSGAMDPSNH